MAHRKSNRRQALTNPVCRILAVGFGVIWAIPALMFLSCAATLHAIPIQVRATTSPSTSTDSESAHAANNSPPLEAFDKLVPLSQIADRAEDLDSSLIEIAKQLSSIQGMLSNDGRAQVQANEINNRLDFVSELVAGVPTSSELRDENYYWSTLNRQYAAYRKSLTSRASYLEDQIRFLDDQRTQWQATLDHNHVRNTRGIKGVAERIAQELNRIQSMREQVQDQLVLVLARQNIASQEDRNITEALSKLSKAQEQSRGHLFERDGYPLWKTRELRKGEQPMTIPISQAKDREFRDARAFARTNMLFIAAILLLYFICLAAAFKLKR